MHVGHACARAALVGNPSDLYGGAVVGVPIPQLRATVEIDDGAAPVITTNIPRAVGLAGSSALVIAALRAVFASRRYDMDPRLIAQLALDVESEKLGIIAGLQDRLVQAFEAPLFMDFAADTVDIVRPARRLILYVAWDETLGASSGDYHGQLRARREAGDREVNAALDELGDLARAAAPALAAGDARTLGDLIDASFEQRRRLGPLPTGQSDLVEAVRRLGLPATSPGSGGSVAGVVDDLDRAQVLVGLGLDYLVAGI